MHKQIFLCFVKAISITFYQCVDTLDKQSKYRSVLACKKRRLPLVLCTLWTKVESKRLMNIVMVTWVLLAPAENINDRKTKNVVLWCRCDRKPNWCNLSIMTSSKELLTKVMKIHIHVHVITFDNDFQTYKDILAYIKLHRKYEEEILKMLHLSQM